MRLFVNLLNRLGGLNKLFLYEPSELVTIMSLLEQALSLYDEKKILILNCIESFYWMPAQKL